MCTFSACIAFNKATNGQTDVSEDKMVKPYKRFQSQGHVDMAYRCSNLNASFLFCYRDNSTQTICLCRPTVTLHQGQGHRGEHEQIWHA